MRRQNTVHFFSSLQLYAFQQWWEKLPQKLQIVKQESVFMCEKQIQTARRPCFICWCLFGFSLCLSSVSEMQPERRVLSWFAELPSSLLLSVINFTDFLLTSFLSFFRPQLINLTLFPTQKLTILGNNLPLIMNKLNFKFSFVAD